MVASCPRVSSPTQVYAAQDNKERQDKDHLARTTSPGPPRQASKSFHQKSKQSKQHLCGSPGLQKPLKCMLIGLGVLIFAVIPLCAGLGFTPCADAVQVGE